MILVDTGYFLALVGQSDQHGARARRWGALLNEPLLVITEFVLLEIVSALSKGTSRLHATQIFHTVTSDPGYMFVRASSVLLSAGMALYQQRSDKDWSLTDCISFHVMRSHNVTRALAYDHHFEQAGFEALLRREPD